MTHAFMHILGMDGALMNKWIDSLTGLPYAYVMTSSQTIRYEASNYLVTPNV
jgi:hypothetical protein